MTDTETIPTAINKRWSLLLPRHRAVRPEWSDGWEPERIGGLWADMMAARLAMTIGARRSPPVVFDVGAEEGDMTALYATWGADVHAFEPNPAVWPNIRAIWEANDLRPLAGHFVGFVADTTERTPDNIEPVIAQPPRDGWPACAYGPVIGDHGFRTVAERAHDTPRTSIDDYVTATGAIPDIITVDVEGAELLVCRGAERTLSTHKPVLYLSVHPEFMFSGYDMYESDLHKFLADLGYVGQWLAHDHEHHWRFVHQKPGSGWQRYPLSQWSEPEPSRPDDPIDVYWLSVDPDTPKRGFWDQGMLEWLFDGMNVVHHEVDQINAGVIESERPGGIVVIPARNQALHSQRLLDQVQKLTWSVVILTGDEESVYPWETLKQSTWSCWVMSPKMGRHEQATSGPAALPLVRKIGCGFRKEQPEIAAAVGMLDRQHDWCFAGQVTHPQRTACVEAAAGVPNGFLVETKGFAQGVDHESYVRMLASSKFALCPAGPVTDDTFRLFEALEAGAIPVVTNREWWEWLFDGPVPFLTIDRWANLPAAIVEALPGWRDTANRTFAWWINQKRVAAKRLRDDAAEARALSGLRVAWGGGRWPARISVVMPTSPIPSHPDTSIIWETISSVRDRLPDAPIYVTFDGVSDRTAPLADQYRDYIARFLFEANLRDRNIVPVIHDSHVHQTGMLRALLADPELERSEMVLYVEHDAPLTNELDFDQLAVPVRTGAANVIRFHHEHVVLPEHAHLMLDTDPFIVGGVPLLRCRQWSQRPHLASTAFYRDLVNGPLAEHDDFIEDRVYGMLQHAPDWNDWRVWMYAPDPNLMLRSRHLDGRNA